MDSTSTLLPTGRRPGTIFATSRPLLPAAARSPLLPRGQTCTLQLPAGATLELLAGRVWLTLDGLADDVFLEAGARWTAPHTGRCVIEGDAPQPAQFRRLG